MSNCAFAPNCGALQFGVVRLHRLARETEFFEDRRACLVLIGLVAERGVIGAWDGDA